MVYKNQLRHGLARKTHSVQSRFKPYRAASTFFTEGIIMRNVSYLNVGQHVNIVEPLYVDLKRKRNLAPHPPKDPIVATLHALETIEDIVAKGYLTHPNTLTQDEILAYALALLQLRECAGVARMERLIKACDALAVTVSSLIDDLASASHAKCEALARFVAHARDMILMSTSEPVECVMLSLPRRTMRINKVEQ
ncbi:MAG: hypothetical protein ACYCZA_05175 [Thiobacillus sp.]